MDKTAIIIIIAVILLGAGFWSWQSGFFTDTSHKVEIPEGLILFYGQDCPHCKNVEDYMSENSIEDKVKVTKLEVYYNEDNQNILAQVVKKCNISPSQVGVPLLYDGKACAIGDGPIIDYFENKVSDVQDGQKVKVPFLGQLEISQMSLPVLTVVLGALDGLNPCAMWVLLLLISILINTRSKKRIWLIGGTFILASGIVYFLILTAWLNLFLAISYVNLTRILIGLFALGLGIWQLKNFITYNPGVCKVLGISSKVEEKLKLKERTEKIATSPLTLGIIGAMVVLALGVNLVEFFCSAGLPAVYTKVLTLSELNPVTYYLYLLAYTFIFMLDDLIVFSVAAFALSKFSFADKYNYWSTLVGGLLILILGILLIFKPAWLMFG